MDRTCSGVAVAVVALAVPTAGATPASTDYSEQVVAAGLTAPTAIAFLPDRRMLVTEKGGALKLVQGGTATTLITIPVCTASEMGLLGIAAAPRLQHQRLRLPLPDEARRGRLRLFHGPLQPGRDECRCPATRSWPGASRSSSPASAPTAATTTAARCASVPTTSSGCRSATPASATAVAPGELDQSLRPGPAALEGKILRLELDGITPAAGNPYIGVPGTRPEVYAFGFRNPFRMSFDPQTGRLWAGDVGQATIEEIDIVQSGGNYAWPHCEGTLPAGCQAARRARDRPGVRVSATGPESLGQSVTGGAFCRPSFGLVGGQYVFGDYMAGKLWIAVPNAARDDIATPVDFVTNAGGPVDIVSGPDEALYWVAINAGEVRKIVPELSRAPSARPACARPLVPTFQQCTSANRDPWPTARVRLVQPSRARAPRS